MDDAISRDAVCNIVNDIRDCISVEGYWAILERLKKLPPVTQKSGKWLIKDRYYHDTVTAECSECHREVEIPTCMEELMYDFCPMCGARMESEVNNG